jgi:DNA ligase 1
MMEEQHNNTEEKMQPHSIAEKDGMALFSDLIIALNYSTKTNEKLQALADYFAAAPDRDKVWGIAIFSGRRPKRIVNTTLLQVWCCEQREIPYWLFAECYLSVGDLAETISLVLNKTPRTRDTHKDLSDYLQDFITLERQDEAIKKNYILENWQTMTQTEIFIFNKLITGGFRVGVSQKMMVNALSNIVELSASEIAHRISGYWDPVDTTFENLLSSKAASADLSKPYPFYLAYALEDEPNTLGEPDEWQAEWKWDGIRGQIIKRGERLFVWSRGEELMTDKFPEYAILKDLLPDGIVLDGEIIPAEGDKVLPFAVLQTRIGRKNVTKKQLQEAPIKFFCYDLLEYNGEDYRNHTMEERRAQLEQVIEKVNHPVLRLSAMINYSSWEELAALREKSRNINSEGVMLKRKSSIYQVGRKRGDWWKWKIDPLTIDCVMIYAQKGSGRRSDLYTDYTFAVRDGENLVAFTKAYSGLTDKEFAQVDYFVKRNAIEKFGPVRTVKPELVFEIAFEGIAASNRHKSGVALRFPRISRWRKDKKPEEINTLDDLKAMLQQYGK